jgi:hypothetical protein
MKDLKDRLKMLKARLIKMPFTNMSQLLAMTIDGLVI